MITNIQFNSDGFRQILTSDGCRELIQSVTDEIKDKADANNDRGGEGFASTVQMGNYGGGRYVGYVSTTDKKSEQAESEDKALTRALT